MFETSKVEIQKIEVQYNQSKEVLEAEKVENQTKIEEKDSELIKLREYINQLEIQKQK